MTTHRLNDRSEIRPNRRWRSFSLRTLLVFTAVVAAFLAWVAKPYIDRRSAVAKVDSFHGGYGIHIEGPNWLRDHVLENKWFYNLSRVSIGPIRDDYDLANPFDDDALRELIPHLNRFSQFRSLYVHDTLITDVGIRYMLQLKNLEQFCASGTKISDIGLADLATFEHLSSLDVRGTNVTADGIEAFLSARPDCDVMWDKP